MWIHLWQRRRRCRFLHSRAEHTKQFTKPGSFVRARVPKYRKRVTSFLSARSAGSRRGSRLAAAAAAAALGHAGETAPASDGWNRDQDQSLRAGITPRMCLCDHNRVHGVLQRAGTKPRLRGRKIFVIQGLYDFPPSIFVRRPLFFALESRNYRNNIFCFSKTYLTIQQYLFLGILILEIFGDDASPSWPHPSKRVRRPFDRPAQSSAPTRFHVSARTPCRFPYRSPAPMTVLNECAPYSRRL